MMAVKYAERPGGMSQVSSAEATRKITSYMTLGREVSSLLRPDVPESSVHVTTRNGAMRILVISDVHLGDKASDPLAVKNILKEAMEPDTYVILAGDLVQGMTEKYPNVGPNLLLNFQEQINAIRLTLIGPLVKSGKVLAAVSRFGSHDDWPSATSLNIPAMMMEGMTDKDGKSPPLIWNGGLLNIKIDDVETDFPVKLFHTASGSGSTINPVKPLRISFINSKIPDDQTTPMGALAGHRHSQAGVSSERVKIGKKHEVQLVLLQNGTYQGTDKNHPDFQFIKRGGVSPQPAGAAMVIRTSGDQLRVVPTYGDERSSLLQRAYETLNKCEQKGITEEMLTVINNEDGGVDVTVDDEASVIALRSHGTADYISPLYSHLEVRMNHGRLNLPTAVITLAHAYIGSSQSETDAIQEVVSAVARSPRATLLVINEMLDPKVPRQPDRLDNLEKLAQLIGQVPEKRRVGTMLDSILRHDSWNKPISMGKDEDPLPPVVTGDYLYTHPLAGGTPLFEGGASIVFQLKEKRFRWLVADGTGNFGSRIDPYLALAQMDRESMVNNDVVTGGNSFIPGALTTPDKVLLAPGWFAPAVNRRSGGKNSMMRVPRGGQGVIHLENGMTFAGGSLRETFDIFTAITLSQGL
ncbi:MAG: metallophosphoesterase, partial [Patescibacteria group bacterium]